VTASMLRPFFISVAGMVVFVLVAFLCGILPESPFLAFIQAEVNDYLSAINYFVPVDAFVTIGSAWLLAVVPWVVSQFAIAGVKILGEWIPFT
jgi:hypothetical protein